MADMREPYRLKGIAVHRGIARQPGDVILVEPRQAAGLDHLLEAAPGEMPTPDPSPPADARDLEIAALRRRVTELEEANAALEATLAERK